MVTKLFNRKFLVLLFVVGMLVLGYMGTGSPASAGTCSGHYWAAVQDGSGNYYGAKGWNSTQDAQVTGSVNNFFVNSTWVRKDSNNYAEIGWTWHGGWSSPKVFVTAKEDGNPTFHKHYQSLGVYTGHLYRTNVLPATYTWVFYVDGTKLPDDQNLNFTNGTTGAQQERYYACDNPNISHWWSLERADSGANFSAWTSLVKHRDDDPDYCLDRISDTEFYVRRVGSPSCDLSN